MTFKEMQDRTIHLGGLGETDRDRIKLFINMARRDIEARGFKFRWLEEATNVATVAGTQTVALPANFKTHGRLRPVTTTIPEPQFVDWYEMDDQLFTHKAAGSSASGIPAYYSIYEQAYVFYPIPNAVFTYSAQFWRTYPDLSADGDLYAMPDEHEDVLIYGALMHQSARDKDPNMVSFWQNMFEGKIRELKTDSVNKQFESPTKIPMPRSYHGSFR